uniref:cell division activator CedA n=1 Tax=Escherichia coli TaxID=562 RepID=UPI0035C1412D
MRLVKPVMKKPLRQQNRQIISYVPRTEPAPPEHAIKMDSFRDVGNDSNLLIVFYVQIMPDDFVMQLHRF